MVRPGYKQTEVGVIPEDWEVGKLPDYLSFFNGKAHEQHISTSGKYTVVNSKFISSEGEVAKQSTENFCPAKRDDILMVMSDLPNGKALAKCFVVDADDRYAVNQRICILRPKGVDPIFFRHQLNRNPYFLAFDDGVSQTHLLNRVFQNCPVFAPSLPEQRAIAAALSDVDAALAGVLGVIAKKQDLKQAAMQTLLTGQTRLPGFSGDWVVRQLGEVVGIRNQKVNTLGADIAAFCIELEQIGQNSGRIESYLDARDRQTSKYIFKAGDVLFGRLRPYLRKYWSADREGVCSTEIWPLVPLGANIVPSYLFQTVQTDSFIEAANSSYGTHMPRCDWGALKLHELSVPPSLTEQTAIAAVLSDMDAEIAALTAQADKTRLLKQAMMQDLLTGRVRLPLPEVTDA
jgi:type I restriction enzyme S subunit